MDILTFSEQLQTGLKERLTNIIVHQDQIAKLGEALAFVREIVAELKSFTIRYQFKDVAEEIRFFKEIKPVFVSQYYYHKKIFAIRLFDSYHDAESIKANHLKCLKRLRHFVKRNRSFYEYCMTNSTHHDEQYFTRRRHDHAAFHKDEKFSTGYDVKLAKLLANELLKKDILQLLNTPQNREIASNSSGLSWTGSKTDLIELIYALHCVESFNNGAGNIKQIASAFEAAFNVSLGDYYRTFQDIRIRKKSQTPFLDQLKAKFTQRMQDFIQ